RYRRRRLLSFRRARRQPPTATRGCGAREVSRPDSHRLHDCDRGWMQLPINGDIHMNGWFGRVVIGVVAIAIVGAATAGIVHAVRDDDHGADVVHVTGAGGVTQGSGDNGTVVVVERDRGWHGGPFFLFPILFLI